MRRIVAATAALLSAAGLVTVASPANAEPSAASASATSSRYTAIAPQRLLDTRLKSDPHFGPIRAGATLALKVAGTRAVPADATAVVLNVTVVTPAGSGHVTAWPNGTSEPTASNLNFVKGQNAANSVIVKIGSKGAVDFDNTSGGSIQLLADVSGYFGAAQADTQGGFTAITPTRLLDTRTATGGHRGAVAAQHGVAFAAAGVHAIPADASAVVLNVTAYEPARGGHVIAYPSGSARPATSNLNFRAGQTVPNLVIVPVGDHSDVSLFNGSSGATNLLADVFGYFSAGSPVLPGGLGALSPERLLDTRYGTGAPRRAIAPQGTVSLAVTGHGGVPVSGVSAVVLNVTAVGPTRGGHLAVYPSGTAPTSSTLNFTAGATVPNLVVARVNSAGGVKIKNESSGTVQLLADVAGFVLDTTRTVPATTASHYVSSLSAISATGDTSEGCVDGASGASLLLLDVGAQTITDLDGAMGVSLTQNTTPVRVTDAQLVTALDSYAAEFARCNTTGTPVRIAIGTNNDGDFTVGDPNYYAPAAAGQDWADNVVDAMAAQPHITFAGADNIESNFSSSEAQAETWVTAFLNNTDANLINNGAVTGCPDTFGSGAQCGAVLDDNGRSKSWTRANYVALSYGLGPGRLSVLPQIYFANDPNQAAQWANIDRSAGLRITFAGSLTQSGIPACGAGCGYTGSQGWAALYNALSTLDIAVSLPVATNLQLT